jgi:hypothetical protein
VVNGAESEEKKLTFGQDNGDVIRMTIEISPDAFVIKNRAGAVIDSIRKTNVGRFGFLDDVTLHITQ